MNGLYPHFRAKSKIETSLLLSKIEKYNNQTTLRLKRVILKVNQKLMH